MSSASRPLIATATAKYSAVRRASSSLTLASTSSTTSTRALITRPLCRLAEEMTDRLEELSHRDRLRQVRFAAALADALLVALHGERGHGDDGNRLEPGGGLAPVGALEPLT